MSLVVEQRSLTSLLFCIGGELQRFAIAVVACQEADVYMIDEPSSYLDVRQRLKAAQVCWCCRTTLSSIIIFKRESDQCSTGASKPVWVTLSRL